MNIAWIGILLLVATAAVEVSSVQRKASPCNRVIRVAESFESHTGRYPRTEEMAALEPELATACGYRVAQDSFALVVSGHRLNPQVYNYDSRRKLWRWE